MAGLEDLVEILAAQSAQQDIAAVNPYYNFRQVPDTVDALLLKEAAGGKRDIAEIALGSLVSGLLGGALQEKGDQYQDVLSDRYGQAVGQVVKGAAEPDVEDLPSRLFGKAKLAGDLYRKKLVAREVERTLERKDSLAENLSKEVSSGVIKNYFDFEKDPAVLAERAKGVKVENPYQASLEKLITKGASSSVPEEEISDTPPQDPRSSEFLRKEKLDIAGLEDNYRNAFVKDAITQQYRTSSIGFRSLINAIKDPSGISDAELIRGAVQAIEPGLAVREGEQAAIANSPSIPDRWRGALNNALTGGTRLEPSVRAGILRIAARRYNEYATSFNDLRSKYEGIVRDKGLSIPNILIIDPAEDVNKLYPDWQNYQAGVGSESSYNLTPEQRAYVEQKKAQLRGAR